MSIKSKDKIKSMFKEDDMTLLGTMTVSFTIFHIDIIYVQIIISINR